MDHQPQLKYHQLLLKLFLCCAAATATDKRPLPNFVYLISEPNVPVEVRICPVALCCVCVRKTWCVLTAPCSLLTPLQSQGQIEACRHKWLVIVSSQQCGFLIVTTTVDDFMVRQNHRICCCSHCNGHVTDNLQVPQYS